jgi:hypothetical protein
VLSIDGEERVTTTVIPFEALIYIDLCTVLLRAHVQFAWLRGEHIERLKIEFNSVGEARMNKNLKHIRSAIGAQATNLPEVSTADLPLKYRNYLNGSLLPAERFIAVVYQTAIRSARSWLPSFLAPNRAIAVTDRCVMLLEDERRAVQPDYAAIRRFVPFNRIQCITFENGVEAVWVSITSGMDTATEDTRFPLLLAEAAALHDSLSQIIAVPILETSSPELSRGAGVAEAR